MAGPRSIRLRSILAFVFLSMALYVGVLWVYLAIGVAGQAAAVTGRTTPIVQVMAALQERSADLSTAVALTARSVGADSASLAGRAVSVRVIADALGARLPAAPFADVPTVMRVPLARADQQSSRLKNVLVEYAALIELGRLPEAEARHHAADALLGELQSSLAAAQLAGLSSQLEGEQAFAAELDRALFVVALWLVGGLVLLSLLAALLWRRIDRHLHELDAGLQRVAAGELHMRLPETGSHELRHLAELFNEMTRVLRERAEQQGRFAAAGELLAGVAHEVNNPLMAIAALAEIRLGEPDVDPGLRDELEQIREQAARAGRLLTGLLRFVRAEAPRPGPVDLRAALTRSLDLLSYRFPLEEVEVVRRFAPDLAPALCDAMRVEQVFVNLLSNALDALRAVPPPRRITVETWVDEDRVCAAVADNGAGVPADVRHRLFRPFVSTKGTGGTGLGLYISREIARAAGGDLGLVPSETGGARFLLTLPRTEGRPAPVDGSGARHEAGRVLAPLAGLRVLVADDEEAIRRPVALYLTKRGAQVTSAADGQAALDVLTADPPDVVVADLRMPGMSGIALYEAICDRAPLLAERVIFLSGDLSQLAELGGDERFPSDRVLAKPVDLAELEICVRSVASLDPSGAGA